MQLSITDPSSDSLFSSLLLPGCTNQGTTVLRNSPRFFIKNPIWQISEKNSAFADHWEAGISVLIYTLFDHFMLVSPRCWWIAVKLANDKFCSHISSRPVTYEKTRGYCPAERRISPTMSQCHRPTREISFRETACQPILSDILDTVAVFPSPPLGC